MFKIFCVVMILSNHYPIILKLFGPIKGSIMYQIKQTALRSGYNFQLMTNLQIPAELKNCKLEYHSLLFGPLAQYLGSDKRRVLIPCFVNCVLHVTYLSFNLLAYL